MPRSILPAFKQWPKEASIIGFLLAGYGELEFELARCVAATMKNDYDAASRVLFRTRGEEQRINIADALIRGHYETIGLTDQYGEALGAIRWCKNVRNQYAHAHWIDDEKAGLFFTDLEKSAQSARGELMLEFVNVDESLLKQQEEYFCYALNWLEYLQSEYRLRDGQISSHNEKAPKIIPQPNRHNPAKTHPLPPLAAERETPPTERAPEGS
jgi:hypothetical protein